jgi:hypothetical protein
MITPTLEKLILCGKAFYKTFIAGGTKHTLNISEDRFIIITDITYFPMNCLLADTELEIANHNTQVAIYGERGYNHFIFRNYNNTNVLNSNIHGFCSPVTINTFMLHEMEVGFSFCNAPYFTNSVNGIANTENPSYIPPIDYGKNGDVGAVPVPRPADGPGKDPDGRGPGTPGRLCPLPGRGRRRHHLPHLARHRPPSGRLLQPRYGA